MVFLSRLMNICTSKQQRVISFNTRTCMVIPHTRPGSKQEAHNSPMIFPPREFKSERSLCVSTEILTCKSCRSSFTEKLLLRSADGKNKTGSRAVSSVFLFCSADKLPGTKQIKPVQSISTHK